MEDFSLELDFGNGCGANMKSDLGSRMKKNYEDAFKYTLPCRTPLIIRIDGKAFHTYTRKLKLEKPFDLDFWNLIHLTGVYVAKQMSGAECVYSQSDEISILFHNYKKLDTNPYAGNELQKLVSHSASMATAYFNRYANSENLATFDSRVFVLPEAEVNNYFIWRQQDCMRNSISSLAQHHFSHKELYGKNQRDMKNMLEGKGVSLELLNPCFSTGNFSTREQWQIYSTFIAAPDFNKSHNYIEDLLKVDES